MPYRTANLWVGLTLLVIILGFWDSYFTRDAATPAAFHVHAISALAWVGLLLVQHWSIHSGRRAIHRTAGLLSLLLFPVLIVGFVMIVNYSAENYANNSSPVMQLLGPSFGLSMLLALFSYVLLYYLALAHRSNIKLHAGYMLATPLILFESPFSRVIPEYLPFLLHGARPFPHAILDQITLAMLLSAAFAFVVYWRVGKQGVPFLLAGVLLVIESATMWFGTEIQVVRDGFAVYATIPDWATIGCGFLLGAVTAWLGWTAPNRQRPGALPQAA